MTITGKKVEMVVMDEWGDITDPDDLRNTPLSRAQALYLQYLSDLRECTSQEAKDSIRTRMRDDDRLIELASHIVEFTAGKMEWQNAIIRAECRRAMREGQERLEQIRQERLAREAEEKRLEQEALSGLSNFGMF